MNQYGVTVRVTVVTSRGMAQCVRDDGAVLFRSRRIERGIHDADTNRSPNQIATDVALSVAADCGWDVVTRFPTYVDGGFPIEERRISNVQVEEVG